MQEKSLVIVSHKRKIKVSSEWKCEIKIRDKDKDKDASGEIRDSSTERSKRIQEPSCTALANTYNEHNLQLKLETAFIMQ